MSASRGGNTVSKDIRKTRRLSLRKYEVKPRGGSKSKIINEECMNLLIQNIEQRQDITLNELRQLLIDIKSVVASISTIARHLEGRLYYHEIFGPCRILSGRTEYFRYIWSDRTIKQPGIKMPEIFSPGIKMVRPDLMYLKFKYLVRPD